MFMVERKKFFKSITGRTYDGGKKLTKVEKKEKEMKELEMKKLKLKDQNRKVEKKKEEKQAEPNKPAIAIAGDDEDMSMLTSDAKEEQSGKGAKRRKSHQRNQQDQSHTVKNKT